MKSLKNSRIRKSTRLNKLKSKQDLSVHFKIVLDNSNQNPTISKASRTIFEPFFLFPFRFNFKSNRKESNPSPKKTLFTSLFRSFESRRKYTIHRHGIGFIFTLTTGLFIGGRGCPGTNGLFLATTRQLGRGGVVDSSGQRVVRLEKEIERAY